VRAAAGFEIPFNRNELADFLCVDRSAMSRELGRMRDEGLIAFGKSRFQLLRPDEICGQE
jgi:CRP-like cAMP-binding protein